MRHNKPDKSTQRLSRQLYCTCVDNVCLSSCPKSPAIIKAACISLGPCPTEAGNWHRMVDLKVICTHDKFYYIFIFFLFSAKQKKCFCYFFFIYLRILAILGCQYLMNKMTLYTVIEIDTFHYHL